MRLKEKHCLPHEYLPAFDLDTPTLSIFDDMEAPVSNEPLPEFSDEEKTLSILKALCDRYSEKAIAKCLNVGELTVFEWRVGRTPCPDWLLQALLLLSQYVTNHDALPDTLPDKDSPKLKAGVLPLTYLAHEKGITQRQLAEMCGMSRNVMQRVCAQLTPATRPMISKIAKALGVPYATVKAMILTSNPKDFTEALENFNPNSSLSIWDTVRPVKAAYGRETFLEVLQVSESTFARWMANRDVMPRWGELMLRDLLVELKEMGEFPKAIKDRRPEAFISRSSSMKNAKRKVKPTGPPPIERKEAELPVEAKPVIVDPQPPPPPPTPKIPANPLFERKPKPPEFPWGKVLAITLAGAITAGTTVAIIITQLP